MSLILWFIVLCCFVLCLVSCSFQRSRTCCAAAAPHTGNAQQHWKTHRRWIFLRIAHNNITIHNIHWISFSHPLHCITFITLHWLWLSCVRWWHSSSRVLFRLASCAVRTTRHAATHYRSIIIFIFIIIIISIIKTNNTTNTSGNISRK